VVVPNGVDIERFDPARVVARDFGAGFKVVFAGSLAPWQGLDTLVRAVAHVPGATAIIAGEGPARAGLEALVQELGVASRVVFLGRVAPDDVPAVLAGADVCYMGHTDVSDDAFRSPLKLYEYLAMGKPVVSSAVPDAVATITDGETGFLFAPGDVDSLVRALCAARGARLAVVGRERHSWQGRVADMITAIERRLV
jgi:glycosyltransferase involved in cell wall biosynthesis